MKKIYFVSGIDTGIGKTVATAAIAAALRSRGADVITVKMVQTGCDGFSEDLEEHRKLMGGVRFYEDELGLTSPQIFKFPASPKLAAELEGKSVDVKRVEMCIDACSRAHETVLVESAGGLDVPLDRDTLSIDLAAKHGWPVILVTCGRLGSINHTLLSLEAMRSRGMKLAAVIHNWCDGADETIDRDAEAMTKEYLAKWGFNAPVIRLGKVEEGAVPTLDNLEWLN